MPTYLATYVVTVHATIEGASHEEVESAVLDPLNRDLFVSAASLRSAYWELAEVSPTTQGPDWRVVENGDLPPAIERTSLN